jgi:hypothetical protein
MPKPTFPLVVGQAVRMRSGCRTQEGKVAEVTEQYVLVGVICADKTESREFIRFDHNGKTGTGWDGLGSFEYIGKEVGMLQSDPRLPGTEFGPWELVPTLTDRRTQ